MKNTTILIGIILLISVILLSVLLKRPPLGGASPELYSSVATSSGITVSSSIGPLFPITIFATSTCLTRVISTQGKAIMLSLGENAASSTFTPTGALGHVQLASTTVAYDSAIYGCGRWRAYAYDATTTITVSEFK